MIWAIRDIAVKISEIKIEILRIGLLDIEKTDKLLLG